MSHLLITKDLQREQVLFLAEKGIEYKVVPALESNYAYNLGEIKSSMDKESVWIFTSKKAVFSINFQLDNYVNKESQQILTVGETSKNALLRMGYVNVVSFNSADELTESMVMLENQKFTFFCGNNTRKDIPEYAAHNNMDLSMVRVYETQMAKPVIEKNGFGAAFYFSPQGVESTLANNPHLKELKAYAIGDTTASALAKKGLTNVVVAPKSNVQDMLNQFVDDVKVV